MNGVTWKPRGLAKGQQRKISSERVLFDAAIFVLHPSIYLRRGKSTFIVIHCTTTIIMANVE